MSQLDIVSSIVNHPANPQELAEIFANPQWNRRCERRLPYFGPATVHLPYALEVEISVFVRDLSHRGIGLVHIMPMNCGEVVVAVPLPSGKTLDLRTQLLWCRDYGNGWYASGGRFLDLLPLPPDPDRD